VIISDARLAILRTFCGGLTSNCADWVKDQIDSANPGWTDLLEKRDPVLLFFGCTMSAWSFPKSVSVGC
jgi:hypothetical protein